MRQHFRTILIAVSALSALSAVAVAVAAFAADRLDGATIVNSGSTNTAGYKIQIRSDGRGTVTVQNDKAKAFTIDPALAQKFLKDAEAARADPGAAQHCMKSVSFGTTLTVQWHEYVSSDLECPPFSAAVAMLFHDVQLIQQAAGMIGPIHRIPRPYYQRQLRPGSSPPAGGSAAPSMSPTP